MMNWYSPSFCNMMNWYSPSFCNLMNYAHIDVLIDNLNPNFTGGEGGGRHWWPITFWKTLHFAAYFIPNGAQITPTQTLGHFSQINLKLYCSIFLRFHATKNLCSAICQYRPCLIQNIFFFVKEAIMMLLLKKEFNLE